MHDVAQQRGVVRLDADAAGVLSGEVVVHGAGSDMVGAFVGKLFCHHFAVDAVKGAVDEQLAGLAALRREWEAMTTRVHKLYNQHTAAKLQV